MADKSGLSLSITADHLDVKAVTLRRWADYHAMHLSPGANPPTGIARRFDSRDLEVLKTVKSLRDDGLSTARINERLAGLTFASIDTTEVEQEAMAPGGHSTELSAVGQQEGLQSTQGIIVALQAMQTQIDAIQQARQEDRRPRLDIITAIGIGICIGLLFAVGMIVLASIYGSP